MRHRGHFWAQSVRIRIGHRTVYAVGLCLVIRVVRSMFVQTADGIVCAPRNYMPLVCHWTKFGALIPVLARHVSVPRSRRHALSNLSRGRVWHGCRAAQLDIHLYQRRVCLDVRRPEFYYSSCPWSKESVPRCCDVHILARRLLD
ncbi:hypothetical protein B0H19DRAFT_487750 [Mycena capillaripes]|nr:hypothetical protein B0H19DRAFT_487750 [Mycena capillaripes]